MTSKLFWEEEGCNSGSAGRAWERRPQSCAPGTALGTQVCGVFAAGGELGLAGTQGSKGSRGSLEGNVSLGRTMGSAQAAACRRPPPGWPRPGRARFSPFPGSSRAGPARPPPARLAHSPADSLVGQLLHAVELFLHGGGGATAAGRGALAGESCGLSGGSYIASRPGRRRRSLRFGPALAASLPARPPAPSARPTEWSRAEPNKAETRGVESSRCERIRDGWS